MSIEIFELCSVFNKLSELTVSKVSVVDNNNPDLQKLSSIKDYDERIDFCKEKWDLLGEGSARAAFQMDKERVLKVATNKKGIAQNRFEMQPVMQTECTCPILEADTQAKWLIFKSNEDLTEARFKEITGIGFNSFSKALWQKFDNNGDENPPQNYDEITQHPLFKSVAKLVFNHDMLLGDLTQGKISSWGEIDGRIIIRDFGMSKDLYKKFYEDDQDSSHTTVKTT